jgi:hypothetical protein
MRKTKEETRFLTETGFLVAVLVFMFWGACATAQEPGAAQAVHRAGQTFITWPEKDGVKEYRIYRSSTAIRTEADLAQAKCVGTADEDTTLNFRAAAGDFRQEQVKGMKTPPPPVKGVKRDLTAEQLAETRKNPAYHHVIEPGGKPLPDAVGLFVYTAKKDESAHYAVLAGEKIIAAAGSVAESVAMPEPVPQGDGLTYVHWVDDVGTDQYPAMGNRASYAFNFIFVPAKEKGLKPLHIAPHARGGNFRMGHRFRKPGPFHDLVPDDDPWAPGDVKGRAAPFFTMWYGYNSICGTGKPITEGVNVNYTERRVLWTIEWVRKHFEVDSGYINMNGGSMGGICSIFYALRHPDLLAAVHAAVPCLDFGSIWKNNDHYVAPIWGKPGEKIKSWDGVDIYDTMRATWYVESHPETDFPIIFIRVGKHDTTVGWADKPPFFRALEATRHGGAFWWDGTGHGTDPKHPAYWYKGPKPPPDMASVAEKAPIELDYAVFRGDQSYPAFSRCSLNDDPGDGNPESGAPHGQINGYLYWDRNGVVDTPQRWEMALKLTPGAPKEECTVDVTPRRLKAFKTAKDEKLRWSIQGGATGEATVDQWGLITAPAVRVTKSGVRLSIERPH